MIAGVQNGISIGQFAPQQVGGSVNLTLPTTGETAEYTLVAVDLAGNLTEYKVTTQPVSDIPAPIEEVTPDNVSGDHRAGIESVKEKAEEERDHNLLRKFYRPMLNIYCPYFSKLLG